jgi:hypothetical protein
VADDYLFSKAIFIIIGILLFSNKEDQKTIIILIFLILLAVFLFWRDYLIQSLLIATLVLTALYLINNIRNEDE